MISMAVCATMQTTPCTPRVSRKRNFVQVVAHRRPCAATWLTKLPSFLHDGS